MGKEKGNQGFEKVKLCYVINKNIDLTKGVLSFAHDYNITNQGWQVLKFPA